MPVRIKLKSAYIKNLTSISYRLNKALLIAAKPMKTSRPSSDNQLFPEYFYTMAGAVGTFSNILR